MTSARSGRARFAGLAHVVCCFVLFVVTPLAPVRAQEGPAAPESSTEAPASPPEQAPPSDDPLPDDADSSSGDATGTPQDVPAPDAAREPLHAPARQDVAGQLAAGSGVRIKLICTNCNSASLSVNGLGGDHVRVFMDGMPTVAGLGTVYAISQFPSDFISHQKVTHGPGSVLTGSAAIGGTIHLHAIPRTTQRRAFLDVGVANDAMHSLKLGGARRWGPFGALIWLQAAEQQNVDANDDGWQEIAEFERLTAQGIFDFHLTDAQVLTLDVNTYGENQLDGPGGPEFDPDPSVRAFIRKDEDVFFNWRSATIRHEWNGPGGLRLASGIRYSRRAQQQWTAPVIGAEQVWTFRIEDEQSVARTQAEIPAGKGMLTVGASWSRMNLKVRQRFVVPTSDGSSPSFIVDDLMQEELWAEYARSLGAKWDVSLGLRHDRYRVSGRTSGVIEFPRPPQPFRNVDPEVSTTHWAPRMQVHFRPTEKVVLGLAAGAGSVGPTPAFAETCCGAKYQRSLQLRPEEAWSYQASVEVRPTPDQRISLRLFRTDFDDYQTKAVYKSEAFVAYYTRRNIPRARIEGFDIVHDMRFKDDLFNVGWTWTLADSWASEVLATDDFNQIELVNGQPVAVAEEGWDVPFTPRHSGSAYFRYDDRDRGLTVNFNWSYQGSLKHFELFRNRDRTDPWSYLSSQAYWTADVDLEQRLGTKGWSLLGGIRNLNDKVQDDFGDINRIYDWGPLQGRTIFAGMKFLR